MIKNKWLFASILLVIISISYWTVFVVRDYNSYHAYWDVGSSAYDMFYHINYWQSFSVLQYLVFANHIAPVQLLILPIYAVFPSALTLLIVQEVILSLTGIIVYLVADGLLKSGPISFALSFAYLANPGMHGIILFDYHSEFLIVPLILILFYSYMKGRKIHVCPVPLPTSARDGIRTGSGADARRQPAGVRVQVR